MGGKPVVTILDVARAAGVSTASVSNYLNGRPYMSDAMRRKIAAAVDSLGYQVNAAARNLRSGRTHLLKLVVPDLHQVYFADLAEAVLARARERGYGVIVESTSNSRERELQSVRSMGNRPADGLLFSPLLMESMDAHEFDGNYPLVMLGERLFGIAAPHVVIRNREASAAATKHLLDAGCRRIAVIGGLHECLQTSSRSLRTLGYRMAMREAGIEVDERLIVETECWDSASGARAVSGLLDAGVEFDAVFALNDSLAWGVLRTLVERGKRVPADIQVMGFDDVEQSSFTYPSLSTVNPGREDIATLAVNSVLAQIESGERGKAEMVPVSYSLVLRESSPALS